MKHINTPMIVAVLSFACMLAMTTAAHGTMIPIEDIQFTTDPVGDSPYLGQTVTTHGVVTAVEAGNLLVFVQDGNGPWTGIALWDPPADLTMGDHVEITGEVSEWFGMTEIWPVESITVLSANHPMPAPHQLATGETDLERWEAVLVKYKNVTVTDPDLGWGEWLIDDGSGPVVVDDRFSYNYIPMMNQDLDHVIGPMNFSYGNFKVEPRFDADIGAVPMPPLSIFDIQHTDDPSGDSPYLGQTVTTHGVVTAVEPGNNHIFIQDGNGPWSGITLWAPDAELVIGDLVEVSGEVNEWYGLTEIWPVYSITVLNSGNQVPQPQVLATGDTDLEMWESVLVRYNNATVTDPDAGWGEWIIDDNTGGAIVNDLYTYTYVPELNHRIAVITGPLNFTYGAFKIEPRNDADIRLKSGALFGLLQQPAGQGVLD